MAKAPQTRITWKASRSRRIVGYKLYWTKGETLNYHPKCAEIGNVNEILLPDDLAPYNIEQGPLKFGLTAINQEGNESDILTIGSLHLLHPPAQSKEWKIPAEKNTDTVCEAEPVACYSDPVKQRLFMYLNSDPSQANCLDRELGFEPLRAYGDHISRTTITETKNALAKLNEQLDQVFPE